jgi:hypothetical protein
VHRGVLGRLLKGEGSRGRLGLRGLRAGDGPRGTLELRGLRADFSEGSWSEAEI